MYSAAVNYWSLRVARSLLKHEGVDLMYLSTTDYMMHTHAPEEAVSLENLHTLDKMLADILDDHPSLQLYLSADHGMNAKTQAVDPIRLLKAQGIDAAAAPIISDNHKVHHQDLGGSYYIYLKKPQESAKAIAALKAAPEVEAAYSKSEAAKLFRLHKDRIGDIFAIARKESVFGDLDTLRKPVRVRTHGSLHEAAGAARYSRQQAGSQPVPLQSRLDPLSRSSCLNTARYTTPYMPFPVHRPRRLRVNESMRRLVRETHLQPENFVLPLFVCPGEGVRHEIGSMPGVAQLSIDLTVKECEDAAKLASAA
jgi:hypothetical protein